jgi:hypothetical protein
MYEAIIAPITNVRPHPKADRLVLATVIGHQVILAKKGQDDGILISPEEGTLGVFFPPDGQISHEMAMANKLYRKDPATDEPMGGYFESNRRVRSQKLRGLYSEGMWLTIDKLSWTGVDVRTLKIGTTFAEINGKLVCNKYYTPSTLARMKRNPLAKSSLIPTFKEHFETKNIRYALGSILPNSIVHITYKLHGTSGRTGYLKEAKKLSRVQSFWNTYCAKKTGLSFPTEEYSYVSGTRRTVIDTSNPKAEKIRLDAHNKIANSGLKQGETIYYELVGFDENGTPIMPDHPVQDSEVKKQYNTNRMRYSYGCGPTECKLFVYRITQTSDDGRSVIELSWHQVKSRCKQLGLEFVPEAKSLIFDGDQKKFLSVCSSYIDGPDVLDSSHTKEGICLRVESEVFTILKWKCALFCDLEGIAKNSDLYVDAEEAS